MNWRLVFYSRFRVIDGGYLFSPPTWLAQTKQRPHQAPGILLVLIKMPNNNTRTAYEQLDQLVYLLISPTALEQEIIKWPNVKPLFYIFLDLVDNPLTNRWLVTPPATFKEAHWLQLIGWLMERDVFVVYQKKRMAEFLHSSGLLRTNRSVDSIRLMLSHGLPPDIEAIVQRYFRCYW